MIFYWITRWKGFARYKKIAHRGNYLEFREVFKILIPNYYDDFFDKDRAIASQLLEYSSSLAIANPLIPTFDRTVLNP
jgi:hypothetical protein